jgi:hypothetical protein
MLNGDASSDFNAQVMELLVGFPRQLLREGRQYARASFNQNDTG